MFTIFSRIKSNFIKTPKINYKSKLFFFIFLTFNITIIIVILNIFFKNKSENSTQPYKAAVVNRFVSTTGNNTNAGTSSGASWATLKYAVDQDYSSILNGGDIVEICIANGTYTQSVRIDQSGLEILPVTPNVSISNGNRITFPSGTNLSSAVIGDYIYIYRSWVSNNGYFQITAVNDSSDWVEVAPNTFPINETGASGNFDKLSASIGRPIILRNCEGGSVVLELDNKFCLGISIVQEKYLIIDGIEVRNSTRIVTGASPTPTLPAGYECGYNEGGGGVGVYESDHIVFDNMKIHSHDRTGIKVGEIYTTQAGGAPGVPGSSYNLFMNSTFYDFGLSGSSPEAIYIGEDAAQCNANVDEGNNYNHIIGNTFTSTGLIEQENAVDVKGACNGNYNKGTVIERNLVENFRGGPSIGNGIFHISEGATHTLVYRNEIKDTRTGPNCQSNNCYTGGIAVKINARDVFIYNNLIHGANPYNSADRIYGLILEGGGSTAPSGNNIVVINNTVHNTGRAIYFQNSSVPANPSPGVVRNNVFSNPQFVTYPYFFVEASVGQPLNNWVLSHNAYTSNPASSILYGYPTTNTDTTYTPNIEVGAIINANLGYTDSANDNYTLQSTSILKDAGFNVSAFIDRDYLLNIRPDNSIFDIGAYEYQTITTPTATPTPTATANPTPTPTPTPPLGSVKNYYVDPISGNNNNNGLSTGSAWQTIQKAFDANYSTDLNAGFVVEVCIKPSIYTSAILADSAALANGLERVALTTGVNITNPNTVQFPIATNLSTVISGDYIYIYKSWKSNNGYYKIASTNNTNKTITVEGAPFLRTETGVASNTDYLSASIGRPVIFRNCTPLDGDVVIDGDNSACRLLRLIGKSYFIIDDIDIRNSDSVYQSCGAGDGVVLTNSSHNVFTNMNLSTNDRNAFRIGHDSTLNTGSRYNLIIGNTMSNNSLVDTNQRQINIGTSTSCTASTSQNNNHNHIINNTFSDTNTTAGANGAVLINTGCDVNRVNSGTVIESNNFQEVTISASTSGVVYLGSYAYGTLIYNNTFFNTTSVCSTSCAYGSISMLKNQDKTYIYNNLFHEMTPNNSSTYRGYSLILDLSNDDGVSGDNVHIHHNTMHRLSRGLYIRNSASTSGNLGYFRNNIMSDPQNGTYSYFAVENALLMTMSNNLYSGNPTSSLWTGGYPSGTTNISGEPGRIINTSPGFTDASNYDFTITNISSARDVGFDLSSIITSDKDLNIRPENSAYDIGAYEYTPPNLNPPEPFNLKQKSGTDSELSVGEWSPDNTIIFEASVNMPTVDNLQLCIEYVEADQNFTNNNTNCGLLSGYGSPLTVTYTVNNIINNSDIIRQKFFKWQARIGNEGGDYSNWVEFGNNGSTDTDFEIEIPPPAPYDYIMYGVTWDEQYEISPGNFIDIIYKDLAFSGGANWPNITPLPQMCIEISGYDEFCRDDNSYFIDINELPFTLDRNTQYSYNLYGRSPNGRNLYGQSAYGEFIYGYPAGSNPYNLSQIDPNTTNNIPVGDNTTGPYIELSADVNMEIDGNLELCIEVVPTDQSFIDSPTECSGQQAYTGSDLNISIYLDDLDYETGYTIGYKWQALARSESTYLSDSDWVAFGGNADDAADFFFPTPLDPPTNLRQTRDDDTDILPGSWIKPSDPVLFKAEINLNTPRDISLCIETIDVLVNYLNPETEFSNFTGLEQFCSTIISHQGSGVETHSVTLPDNIYTVSHFISWQMRLLDEYGNYSDWVTFSGNDSSNNFYIGDEDFRIDHYSPKFTNANVDNGYQESTVPVTDIPTELSGSWSQASDTYSDYLLGEYVSGIAFYEYAIGTSIGDTSVLDWTNNGDSTSFTASNLSLSFGVPYFISVRATDNAGNVSNEIIYSASVSFQSINPTPTPTIIPTVIQSDNKYVTEENDFAMLSDFSSLGFDNNNPLSESNQNDFVLNSFIESFDAAQSSALGFKFKSGLQATWEANVATISSLENTYNSINLYDRLKFSINPAGNPTSADGARFAIQVSKDNFSTFSYLNPNTFLLDNIPNPDLSTYYKPCAQTNNQPADDNRWDCGITLGVNRFITGLTPSTNYQVRVSTLNGNFTNSIAGPSTSNSTLGFELTYTIIDSNVNLGTLSSTNYSLATTNPKLQIESNAIQGYDVFINGQGNGVDEITGLYSTINSKLINSVTGNLSDNIGNDGFGINASVTGGTATLAPKWLTTPAPRNSSYVGQITRTPQLFCSRSDSSSSADELTLNIGASVKLDTPAGSDYREILSFFILVKP